MGLEFPGHAAGFLDEAADGAQGDRQVLGADHDQRHTSDQGDFRPREIEHEFEQVLLALWAALLAPKWLDAQPAVCPSCPYAPAPHMPQLLICPRPSYAPAPHLPQALICMV